MSQFLRKNILKILFFGMVNDMLTHVSDKGVNMVDISGKKASGRKAVAMGTIYLRKDTIKHIQDAKTKKGNVLATAQVAGIMAAKETSSLIPMCHQIPLDLVSLEFDVTSDSIVATCTVKTQHKTGVEMEALVGVNNALLTIWDMVKSNEKDERGQYPVTHITGVHVVRKEK